MNTCKIISAGFLVLIGTFLSSFELPENWHIAGSKPEAYKMGIDPGAAATGGNAATIQSVEKKISGFGTLMQTCKAGIYKGKRVRMRAMFKSEDVKEWSGIWLRIDKYGNDEPLAFDNMTNGKTDRSVTGTTPWKQVEVVLDVSPDADEMAYGALLAGTGKIWFDNVQFEVVGMDVPVTVDANAGSGRLEAPANLDFDK